MAQSIKVFDFTENSIDFKQIENFLLEKWKALSTIPNIFRYELCVEKQKILSGKYQFMVQVCKIE
jgi:hypothetical protein